MNSLKQFGILFKSHSLTLFGFRRHCLNFSSGSRIPQVNVSVVASTAAPMPRMSSSSSGSAVADRIATILADKSNMEKSKGFEKHENETIEDTSDTDETVEYRDMTPEDFFSTLAPDPVEHADTRQIIQDILTEYEMAKYTTAQVPSCLTEANVKHLLKTEVTNEKRQSYFKFLYKREQHRLRNKRVKEAAKKETAQKLSSRRQKLDERGSDRIGLWDGYGHPVYGLWHNTPFSRVTDQALKTGAGCQRLRQAAIFGPKLILDFDLALRSNSPRYSQTLTEQIAYSYGYNRYEAATPFDLWFTSFYSPSKELLEHQVQTCVQSERPRSTYYDIIDYFRQGETTVWPNEWVQFFSRTMPQLFRTRDHYVTMKESPFLDHFPRSRLVYITQGADRVLADVDPDLVHILPVSWDNRSSREIVRAKCIKNGIQMRRLPLDQYLAWSGAPKTLCLNHYFGVLQDVHSGIGWRDALLKWVPSRKLKSREEILNEEARRLTRTKKRLKIDAKRPKQYRLLDDREEWTSPFDGPSRKTYWSAEKAMGRTDRKKSFTYNPNNEWSDLIK